LLAAASGLTSCFFGGTPAVCATTETSCGRKCCGTGTTCTHFSDGSESCEPSCTRTRDCTATGTCCVDTTDGAVCLKVGSSTRCLCQTAEDCTTQGDHTACTPWGNGDTITAKKSFCNANDGSAGAGCKGNCCNNTADDCRTDNAGNQYCARQCVRDSDCGSSGVACCVMGGACKNCLFGCSSGSCAPCP
jgi:hypothetical protein